MTERAPRGIAALRSIAIAGLAVGAIFLSGCASGEVRACKKDCPIEVVAVCGVDAKQYNNSCEAKCYGVEIDYEGPCKI